MAKRVASRTQIPSLAPKRRRRALEAPAPPGLPCASGQIQMQQSRSRGVKRRNHHLLSSCSVTTQTSCSWGATAKRARTARSGTPAPGLWCRPVCRHSSVCVGTGPGQIQYPGPRRGEGRRKALVADARGPPWADLGDGPAGLVAELVLANDVADYVRFRAVCRAWRRCAADPRSGVSSLDGRFVPRKWTMLDKAHDGRCRRFLNISTGECVRTDLPELAPGSGHTLLAVAPEGLLLLVHERTLVVRLLNPLTRQLTDLPPVTALLAPEQKQALREGCSSVGDVICVDGFGVADASVVAVCFSSPRVLAVARPGAGDGCWTVVDAPKGYVDSALTCAGRFYCACGNSVMVLDTSSSGGPEDGQPRLRPVAVGSSLCFFRLSCTLHLIDNAGELMLVHRMLSWATAGRVMKYKRKYEVWKVDVDAGALVLANDLGGRSVLLSLGRTVSISVPAAGFPSVTADTLYLGLDCDDKTALNQIDAYNVADGSSQPSSCHHKDVVGIVQPWSAVDCLAYCIQSNGEHLA